MRVVGFGNESSLHSAIKTWIATDGDRFEVMVDGFVVDIVRGNLLIEVQTRNFSAVKEKICRLIENHHVRLVHPIAAIKRITHVDDVDGKVLRSRISPKKGRVIDIFDELVRIPHLIKEASFELEVLMIEEEEIRCNDGQGSWRRHGISIKNHILKRVVDDALFRCVEDYVRLLPSDLVQPFTSRQLAMHLGTSLRLARRMSYCLQKMGGLKIEGKFKRALLFKTLS